MIHPRLIRRRALSRVVTTLIIVVSVLMTSSTLTPTQELNARAYVSEEMEE